MFSVSITKGPQRHSMWDYELPDIIEEYKADNVFWVVFRPDTYPDFPGYPVAVYSDYEKLREDIRNDQGYGRVEAYFDGLDCSKLEPGNEKHPTYSHMHFGSDPASEHISISGDCSLCEEEYERLWEEEEKEIEVEVISHEEKDIGEHHCIMEVCKCPLCNQLVAWFGVEEWGMMSFGQEHEDEEFVLDELYAIFVEHVISKGE